MILFSADHAYFEIIKWVFLWNRNIKPDLGFQGMVDEAIKDVELTDVNLASVTYVDFGTGGDISVG